MSGRWRKTREAAPSGDGVCCERLCLVPCLATLTRMEAQIPLPSDADAPLSRGRNSLPPSRCTLHRQPVPSTAHSPMLHPCVRSTPSGTSTDPLTSTLQKQVRTLSDGRARVSERETRGVTLRRAVPVSEPKRAAPTDVLPRHQQAPVAASVAASAAAAPCAFIALSSRIHTQVSRINNRRCGTQY
jgi:hypothetical protein